MQAVHERLAGEGAGLLVSVEHRIDLEGGKRHRLLDEDMLAGLRRLDRPFGVAGMRRRDVDRLHLGIVEQRLVAIEDARAGEFLGKALSLRVAGSDRDQRAAARRLEPAVEILGDAAWSKNAPAHGGCGYGTHQNLIPWSDVISPRRR